MLVVKDPELEPFAAAVTVAAKKIGLRVVLLADWRDPSRRFIAIEADTPGQVFQLGLAMGEVGRTDPTIADSMARVGRSLLLTRDEKYYSYWSKLFAGDAH